ncbi:MAG: hypothetical protein ACXWAC_14080 [Usitatibacter sp.]
MNKTVQIATGLIAVLMFGTIVLKSTQSHSQATNSASEPRQAEVIVVAVETSRELPQDQVRDLTY